MWKSVVANDQPEPQLVVEESGGVAACTFAKAITRLLQAPDAAGQWRRHVRESRSSQGFADCRRVRIPPTSSRNPRE